MVKRPNDKLHEEALFRATKRVKPANDEVFEKAIA
jgi:hypothetical protein